MRASCATTSALRVLTWPRVAVPDRLPNRRGRNVRAPRVHRRQDPGNNAREHEDGHRKRQHGAIDFDAVDARQRRGGNRYEQRDRQPRSRDTGDAADREHRRDFRQCLQHEAAARRSQRETHGELARPARGPRAEQTREVQAGDEKKARHSREHHVQRWPDGADRLFRQRQDFDANATVGRRVFGFEPPRECVDLALRLLDANAGLEPRDGEMIVTAQSPWPGLSD